MSATATHYGRQDANETSTPSDRARGVLVRRRLQHRGLLHRDGCASQHPRASIQDALRDDAAPSGSDGQPHRAWRGPPRAYRATHGANGKSAPRPCRRQLAHAPSRDVGRRRGRRSGRCKRAAVARCCHREAAARALAGACARPSPRAGTSRGGRRWEAERPMVLPLPRREAVRPLLADEAPRCSRKACPYRGARRGVGCHSPEARPPRARWTVPARARATERSALHLGDFEWGESGSVALWGAWARSAWPLIDPTPSRLLLHFEPRLFWVMCHNVGQCSTEGGEA